jgi:hypothetical protein
VWRVVLAFVILASEATDKRFLATTPGRPLGLLSRDLAVTFP